jgi:cytochrome oxidase Cu insertion factor (SCO1/SenC/PrrC family)/thiol-disulfide isomerase/thioredoxin
MRRLGTLLALVALLAGAFAASARADGDPGSDVLVYQSLFLEADAGITVPQQAALGKLLRSAASAGFPIRVAVIASRSDLGAITGLWRAPRSYARFLGLELSLAYRGRLLVVMPNGFGFNWPGHSSASAYRTLARVRIGSGGSGLTAAVQGAVAALAAQAHVKLGAGGGTATGAAPASSAGGTAAGGGPAATAHGADTLVALIAVVGGLLAAAVLVLRRRFGLGPRLAGARRRALGAWRAHVPAQVSLAAVALLAVLAIPIVIANLLGSASTAHGDSLATNPELDPGTSISRPAPGFTLTDQFGRSVSLRSFRGKVVVLAFNDSECTTVCPLTTSAMVQAKAMLGAAGDRVQLLGIDANPRATALQDVLSYSELHGMLHAWHFLTGSLPQLRAVWKAYSIGVEITQRQIDHTPAVFVIDPAGRLAKVYLTQPSYAAVGQFGQVLANEIAGLLPGHPSVDSHLSYGQIKGLAPTASVSLPRAGGGTAQLGPGGRGHLLLFFDTWDREITGLAGQMEALKRYQALATSSGLPPLTAVDEGPVEASPTALGGFLSSLPSPLTYPVAVDRSGRLADGYHVLGEPWMVLTSPSGKIVWYWQVSSDGWPSTAALAADIKQALSVRSGPTGAAAIARELAGSPAPLAAIHRQSGRLLGNVAALTARLRTLRGYPVVINAWASWCPPCQAEFGLFADASARYGRKVAFLGVDTNDSPSNATAFLAEHPVSYPSYQGASTDLSALASIESLPTTIFVGRSGKVVFVKIGQYDSQGALDADIQSHALGG